MGAAVCRRHCFNIPRWGVPPTSRRQAVPSLQGVWANNQPQEDQHRGARCWVFPPVITIDNTELEVVDTSAWEDIAKHWDTWWQSNKAGVSKESRLHAGERQGKMHACILCVRFHKARLRHLQQRLPLQDRATQSYKILPKSPALTIASLTRGCHYYYY